MLKGITGVFLIGVDLYLVLKDPGHNQVGVGKRFVCNNLFA